jgi:L-asparaginase type I
VEQANVLVLYTGGTIGMTQTPNGYAPVEGYFAKLLKTFPQLHDPAYPPFTTPPSRRPIRIRYDLRSYEPLLDSANVRLSDWARFARDIAEAHDRYDGFVILHGTDTMAYTASALSFLLEGLRKPVILTGAQIPLENLRNDALDNLLGALGIAGHYPIPEVGLFFHHRLLRGNRATKVDAGGLDAFASPNLPPLVDIGIDVDVNWELLRPRTHDMLRLHTAMSPNVTALRLYPGITRTILENVLQPPLEGLVLETYGAGNAPHRERAITGPLRAATDRGVVIVNVTQCLKGRVADSPYATGKALVEAGVVDGADMTVEAALTKLAFLLGQRRSPEEVRAQMGIDLRGELSPASDRRSFPPPAAH